MNEQTENLLKKIINKLKESYQNSPTLFMFLLGVCVGLFIAFIF